MADAVTQFSRSYRVQWIDTDLTGFAHFCSYLRMMEETEYAFLRSKGLSVVMNDERGILGFPRLSANLDVVRPLELDEWVEIQLNLARMDGKQIDYRFEILDAEGIAVRGHFRVAACRFPPDAAPYAILIPPKIQDQLSSVETT
jgi:YbgC/YbaW family acyl-CoA thioester hydrolase